MAIDNIGQVPSYEQEEYTSFRGDLDFEQESGGRTWDKDSEVVTDYFPQPPLAFEEGYTFLSLFDADENSIYCKKNYTTCSVVEENGSLQHGCFIRA